MRIGKVLLTFYFQIAFCRIWCLMQGESAPLSDQPRGFSRGTQSARLASATQQQVSIRRNRSPRRRCRGGKPLCGSCAWRTQKLGTASPLQQPLAITERVRHRADFRRQNRHSSFRLLEFVQVSGVAGSGNERFSADAPPNTFRHPSTSAQTASN